MYFKKLDVFGFKSFADKTVLNFEPGITAIVGPNGCGKSNVFDAIRWVLGEQSIKELRGSSMEDVIFNGTDKKPALGFVEVSLTFSNESGMLPIEYNEVTVTRRLYRSGESEYLLNKTTVRLRDIQELFMGTGIGAEAYSLVQQGKVDLVVSAKPEERRVILDEASGITKYKSKKREALNKLKDTENNLLRVNDIIIEVKRQIASIERQANKARRYKEEFEKLKNLEVLQTRYQVREFSSKKSKIQEKLEGMQDQEQKWTAELEELDNLLESQSNVLNDLEQKINEVNSEEIKLESQIDINNKQVGFNDERISSLNDNSSRLMEKKAQLIERCRIQQGKIEELKNEINSVNKALEEKTEALKDKKNSLAIIESAVSEAKKSIIQFEENILELTSKQVSVKNGLTEVMKEIQGCLARKRRLEVEVSKVFGEKQEVDDRLKDTCEQIQSLAGRLQSLKGNHEEEKVVFSEIKSRISSLHRHITDLEKKRLLLKSQKEFIEKLQVQYQDMPDPIVEGRLITGMPPSTKHTGIIGKVREVQYLDSEKCKLFKNGFVKEPQSEQLYEVVCELKFIEVDPEQLTVKMDDISREIELRTKEKEEQIVKIEDQEIKISQLVKTIHDEEKALSILESQKRDILEETDKLNSELELVDSEITEARENLNQLKKREEEQTFYLDSINQDVHASQRNIKEKQNFITVKMQDKETTTVAIAQLGTEIDADQEKEASLQENLKMFEETLDNELEEIKKIDDEQAEYTNKKEEFENETSSLRDKIEDLKQEKASLKDILSGYEKQKNEELQRVNAFRSNRTALESDLEELRQQLHTQQMKGQEISFSQKGIKDRLLQTYKIDVDQINEEELQQTAAELNLPVGSEEFSTEVERLKKRCDSFGSVNLVAIEEFDQLKERFEFLTKQQSDLLEAKQSLHQTINKINRKTRQMFLETFTKVSEEFRIYFRMLFGGGEAQLVLLDPENVLESGIDIVARPPGKKLQNISLLSGGEKSLTAIALVFGVFKVRPSPFCVLDEIDAALDESNVGRFSYLLKDFAQIAQFIVITHNKKTIASANAMYGITMQETGVSKVVSVKFSDEDKEADKEAVAVGV